MILGSELEKALDDLLRTSGGTLMLRQRVYRYTELQHLPTLFSLDHVKEGNNRYTAAGVSKALYAANNPELAIVEATRRHQRDYTAPIFPPHIVVPLDIDLEDILDLTHPPTLDALETNHMELTGDWRNCPDPVATQELGAMAKAVGFTAIRYPSVYREHEWNLVIFSENVTNDEGVVINLHDSTFAAVRITNDLAATKDNPNLTVQVTLQQGKIRDVQYEMPLLRRTDKNSSAKKKAASKAKKKKAKK